MLLSRKATLHSHELAAQAAVSEVQQRHPSHVFEDADAMPTICELSFPYHPWPAFIRLATTSYCSSSASHYCDGGDGDDYAAPSPSSSSCVAIAGSSIIAALLVDCPCPPHALTVATALTGLQFFLQQSNTFTEERHGFILDGYTPIFHLRAPGCQQPRTSPNSFLPWSGHSLTSEFRRSPLVPANCKSVSV